jgi:very-short-patch-repair endonuclease
MEMDIAVARRLRKRTTDAEQKLWFFLRRRALDGCRFRRQAPIGRYFVDFICHERRLIVEVDGSQHAERQAYDAARTQWLEAQGYKVLRFWNNDVLQNTDSVREQIYSALRAQTPLPNPPPQGGRELQTASPKMEIDQ